MATIKQIYGTNTAITVTGLSTLADDGVVASAEIDNSSNLHLADDIQVALTGTGTGYVNVYYMRANDTGDYPSTDESSNMTFLMSVNMNATTPLNNARIEQLPQFYELVFVNLSGAALTAATVERQSADLTNA